MAHRVALVSVADLIMALRPLRRCCMILLAVALFTRPTEAAMPEFSDFDHVYKSCRPQTSVDHVKFFQAFGRGLKRYADRSREPPPL